MSASAPPWWCSPPRRAGPAAPAGPPGAATRHHLPDGGQGRDHGGRPRADRGRPGGRGAPGVQPPGHQGRPRPRRRRAEAGPEGPQEDPAPKKKGGTPSPNKFKVTVAADVPPGNYDVRAVGKDGVSNPRTFVVGDLPRGRREGAEQRRPGGDEGRVEHDRQRDHRQPDGRRSLPVRRPRRASGSSPRACAESIDSRAQPLVEVYDASRPPARPGRTARTRSPTSSPRPTATTSSASPSSPTRPAGRRTSTG